jgi:acyl carrier protein phosphodiesterase
MIDHAHIVFRESSSEPGEGGMIGSGIVKGKPQELFEGDSVVDLGFQLRVGIDLKPLLKKKALHKENRRIGVISFKAFTDGVISQKQGFYSGPVHSGV